MNTEDQALRDLASSTTRHQDDDDEQRISSTDPVYRDDVSAIAQTLYVYAYRLATASCGFPYDPVKAKMLYESATLLRHAAAAFNLGYMYHIGAQGTPINLRTAASFYHAAIEHSAAFTSSSTKSVRVHALNGIALLTESGFPGQSPNPVRAQMLYEEARRHTGGDVAAYNLAVLLERGAVGVSRDWQRAVQLYEEAAQRGNGEALYRLGQIYEDGLLNRRRDVFKALQLYKMGVMQGSDVAEERLKALAPSSLQEMENLETDIVLDTSQCEDKAQDVRKIWTKSSQNKTRARSVGGNWIGDNNGDGENGCRWTTNKPPTVQK